VWLSGIGYPKFPMFSLVTAGEVKGGAYPHEVCLATRNLLEIALAEVVAERYYVVISDNGFVVNTGVVMVEASLPAGFHQ